MGARIRRQITLSPAIDRQINERAQADGENRSRTIENCVREADGNLSMIRHELRGSMQAMQLQCELIKRETRQPGALEAVAAMERVLAGVSLLLASKPTGPFD